MTTKDQRAAEGLEHLQTAALELIEAARAFLDVAEEVVADKARVGDVVSTVVAMAEAAASAGIGAPPRAHRRSSGSSGPGGSSGSSGSSGPTPDGRPGRPGASGATGGEAERRPPGRRGIERIEVS